jgi:hypothetical protein
MRVIPVTLLGCIDLFTKEFKAKYESTLLIAYCLLLIAWTINVADLDPYLKEVKSWIVFG